MRKESCVTFKIMRLLRRPRSIYNSDVDVVTISICTLPGFHSVFEHDGSVSSLPEEFRGPTEDIISYFTLMSSEIHYYDIIEKMGSWTLMSSGV